MQKHNPAKNSTIHAQGENKPGGKVPKSVVQPIIVHHASLVTGMRGEPMNHTPQAEYAIFERIAQLEEQLASWQQHCEENQRLLQAERAKREEMEQAMYRSETLFRELIQHNRDPIIVIHDDIIRSVNAAAEALLERKSDELVGENIGLLMAAGSTEVDILGKRGTHTIADMQVVDIEWEGDRVSLASLRDITDYKRMAEELQRSHDELEQRVLERTSELAAANQALQAEIAEHERTEQALRESEERFRTISELVSDFAYSLSIEPGGKPVLEWITDAFTTITGFTAQEVEAQGGWYSLTYKDDQTLVKQHHDWMLAGFQSDEYEFRILTRQGNIRWLRNHCRGLWDEQEQRVVRIYGGVKDIT
jgi:PAS domain S-box-containing protein